MPCATLLSVSQGGAAGVTFGGTATCNIGQVQPDEGEARIATRDPRNALFRMEDARVLCTITEAGTQVPLCGDGTLIVSEAMQVSAECEQGSTFGVIAYAGSLRAIFPNGEERAVLPGRGLLYEFDTGELRDVTANFNPPEEELFAQQAIALGLQPLLRRSSEVVWDDGPLFATEGEWSAAPAPTFAYQWQGSCSSFDDDAECSDIVGEIQPAYTPSESDCPAVRVVVTAANASGSNASASRPFDLGILGLCSTTTTTSATGATGSPS